MLTKKRFYKYRRFIRENYLRKSYIFTYKEMDRLPEKCREIFTMSYLEERKTSEIAVLLNISTRTVEAQLYKALKILRGILLSCLIFLSNY